MRTFTGRTFPARHRALALLLVLGSLLGACVPSSGDPAPPTPSPTAPGKGPAAADSTLGDPPSRERGMKAEGAGSGPGDLSVTYTVISDSIPDHPEMDALVRPYRERLEKRTSEVIGRTEVLLAKAQPEGTLGNFAADAMLRAARKRVSEPVHMAVTNNGGLRVPIPPGPITMGQMFELMPFENMLSLLVLSGSQVQELADQIAARGGEPIAGFSFRIQRGVGGRTALEVRVAGEPLDPQARYRLVTNDYMANGGENFTPLVHPLSRTDLTVLLRDAFVEYVREKGTVAPEIGGRIVGGIGE